MRARHLVLVFALALAACGSNPDPAGSIVTEPVRYMETDRARAAADLGPSAIAYVAARTDGTYEVVSQTTGAGLRHVRLQQTHEGVPVHHSIVIAHADDTTFLGLNGTLTRNLDGFDVAPQVTGGEALAAAAADRAGGDPAGDPDGSSVLVILPGAGGLGARLVWRVSLDRWKYYLDARDGSLVRKYHNAQTAVLQASGPGRVRAWDAELDVEEDDGEFKMETERLKTMDASEDDEVVKAPDVDNMPDTVANDAHGHAEITLAMMRDWMGRNSIDDDGYKIESRVHDDNVCDLGPDNACWDGEKVNYGTGTDGSTYDWGSALDLVGHEINHGFTEFHSGLEYDGQSGALNESFSDIAGTLAEFYQEGDDADFDFAEDIVAPGGGPLRFLCDPTTDGASVDHAGDLYDDIDVHYSSGIGNRAFCLAVGRYRAAVDDATPVDAVQQVGHVWYTANAAYWTSGSDFADACRGTVDAARAAGMTSDLVEAIGQSWADVGADCDTSAVVCDLDGECEDSETCASCPDDCGSCSDGCSFWRLLKCRQGIGDCSACNGQPGCGDHVCAGDETDESCAQDCGCAALGCQDISPYGCYCDDACDDNGDCCADRGNAC